MLQFSRIQLAIINPRNQVYSMLTMYMIWTEWHFGAKKYSDNTQFPLPSLPRMRVKTQEYKNYLLFYFFLPKGPLFSLHFFHHSPPFCNVCSIIQGWKSGLPGSFLPGSFNYFHFCLSCWKAMTLKGQETIGKRQQAKGSKYSTVKHMSQNIILNSNVMQNSKAKITSWSIEK